MQVLEARGRPPKWRVRPVVIALSVLTLVAVALVVVIGSGKPSKPPKHAGQSSSPTSVVHFKTISVSSSDPTDGEQNVASNATIKLTFSAPFILKSVHPSLSPPVAGSWVQPSPSTLEYDLAAPLVPSSTEIVSIPGGSHGMVAIDGGRLASNTSITFTVADGDTTRLQQLLAELNFLPLSFTPSGSTPAPQDMALPQPGSFSWRWASLPTELTSQWTPGTAGEITKAAVEAFENQNGLGVDGLAGPAVWSALLKDVATQKVDSVPYVYVLVSKVIPENLTLYNDGSPEYTNIPVNSGAPGADTTDGTYAVFEHVVSSVMKGTNPDGTKYDDPDVPWASYFNGGDALHGFVRAHYGYPQSNGCIEMSVADAAMLWPLTPIGTLVTIEGPAVPSPPTTPPSTTPTTVPATTTTG
jgi:peptidoglycan hydrolase-like protein with peptidoglycan-binding domain